MSNISEFLKGKNIFITGGSGFVGKALIEKLLRSSPEIGNIFILIREKRSKSLVQRVQEITDNPLFDTLKSKQPNAVDKIIPILGDITQLRLGISDKDEKLLISKVNIIYNCAASVRFDDLLRVAIKTNLRSARELISLALKCEKLEVLAHISTSYSNADRNVIEEKCYPALVKWQDAIMLAEQDNPHLEALTLKYIAPMPNTYTFTKRLAEDAVVDLCTGKIPFLILRPSIVISTFVSPIPGWVDNLNGPFGLAVGALKGILKVLYARADSSLDFVFVDNVVKALIIAVWRKGTRMESSQTAAVYNITTDTVWMMQCFTDCLPKLAWIVPLTGRIWFSDNMVMTSKFYYYQLFVLFKHIMPALFLDTILKLTGRIPKVLMYTRRIYIANDALQYFSNNSFTFKTENYENLENSLLDSDWEDFRYYRKSKTLSIDESMDIAKVVVTGIKKYILHEPVPVEEETYKNTKWLYYIDIFVRVLLIGFLLYLLLWKLDILEMVSRASDMYINKLSIQLSKYMGY